MADKTDSNNLGQGIAIEELLAAPFVAAASANTAMANKQTAFLMDTCFESVDKDDGESYVPKMVTLTLMRNVLTDRSDRDGKPIMEKYQVDFQVPILTLVPLNSLSVTDVNVKFELEIVSQAGNGSAQSNKNSEDVQLRGTVGVDSKNSNQYSRRNAAKLSVEMNAGTIPLPLGLTTLLELYSKNINTTSSGGKAS